MKFKANENLFRIGDNWVCVSDDEIREGDWVYNEGSVMKFTAFPKMHYKKILFSYPNHIDDSIPVLDGDTQPKEIEMIEVEMEAGARCNTCNKQGLRHCAHPEECGESYLVSKPITLPNGKVKCKIKYKKP